MHLFDKNAEPEVVNPEENEAENLDGEVEPKKGIGKKLLIGAALVGTTIGGILLGGLMMGGHSDPNEDDYDDAEYEVIDPSSDDEGPATDGDNSAD